MSKGERDVRPELPCADAQERSPQGLTPLESELLEALRLALVWLPAAADHPSADAGVYRAIEAAEAAIAKVEGRRCAS